MQAAGIDLGARADLHASRIDDVDIAAGSVNRTVNLRRLYTALDVVQRIEIRRVG